MKYKVVNILLKNKIINEDEKSIYEYGCFVILFNLICMLSVIIIGILLNELKTSFIFIIAFLPIRVLSGGFHLKSPLKCLLFFSTCYFILLNLYIKFNSLNNYFILSILAIYFIFILLEYINKPKILIPLIIIIIIEYAIFILYFNLYILQYGLLFNTVLYFLPKILDLFKIKKEHEL